MSIHPIVPVKDATADAVDQQALFRALRQEGFRPIEAWAIVCEMYPRRHVDAEAPVEDDLVKIETVPVPFDIKVLDRLFGREFVQEHDIAEYVLGIHDLHRRGLPMICQSEGDRKIATALAQKGILVPLSESGTFRMHPDWIAYLDTKYALDDGSSTDDPGLPLPILILLCLMQPIQFLTYFITELRFGLAERKLVRDRPPRRSPF